MKFLYALPFPSSGAVGKKSAQLEEMVFFPFFVLLAALRQGKRFNSGEGILKFG